MKFKIKDRFFGQIAAGLAFLSAYGFFQIGYPYHLMRREQLTLFVYDWGYICETYKGIGGLRRFAGDFVDQFLCFPVVGPVLIALLLTAIGTVTYRICRRWLGKWASLGIAFIVFGWAFIRETGNLYITEFTIAILGYLSLVLAALQFRKVWQQACAAVLLLAAAVPLLGKPYYKYFGEMWGTPEFLNEQVIGLDIQASRYNWDKLLKLSAKRIYVNEAVYLTNLALACKGQLGNEIFNYPDNYANGIFLWVDGEVSQFTIGMAGEAWYHMGNMTIAEQSAIVGLQQSPKHVGARYIKRLAEITLITGEYGAAQKYLNLLGRTLVYRKWANDRMPGNFTPEVEEWLSERRSMIPKDDLIIDSNYYFPDLMRDLLRANPDNLIARQYLLVYDLLNLRIEDFAKDYSDKMITGAIYEQAMLIWLSIHNRATEEEAIRHGVQKQTMQKLLQFYRYPDRYENTYWYYYMDATTE